MVVAVAETATTWGKAASGKRRAARRPARCGKRAALVLAAVAGALPLRVAAQIVGAGSHASAVTQTPNGLAQVNINRPDSSGASLKTYRQFDVPQDGDDAAPGMAIDVSQLGGMYGNRIFLAATEFGVGVANAGMIAAHLVDRFNGQLHPEEKKWIDKNVTVYAKAYGLTLEQARAELTTRANLQVPSGSSGRRNQRAAIFLLQTHGMLPADGDSGPGYMFYATPEPKANTGMYAKYYPDSVGLNAPDASSIESAVNRDKAYQTKYSKLTLAAAVGAAMLTVAGPIAALRWKTPSQSARQRRSRAESAQPEEPEISTSERP